MKKTRHNITVKNIIELTKGKLMTGSENVIFENFSINSKKIKKGDFFIGFIGENVNGGVFFEEAFKNGAIGCIIQDIHIHKTQLKKYQHKAIIVVSDVVLAIQQMAKLKRSLYDIPVIAITGSVGKTSTKDMIASVLSQKYKTLKTEGNHNNHIGLPLTILKLKDHEALILEMGMNHLGEIRVLTKIANPTVAIITNIGTAHIGILGSRENILKAKLEILEGLQDCGKIIINNDNDLLHTWYEKNKLKNNILTYGIENKSNFMPKNIILFETKSKFIFEKNEVLVPVPGNHFVLNSLCAIAVGEICEVSTKQILKGIQDFKLTKNRMELSKIKNNIIIINDCYNANFDSMKAAIEYLGKIKMKRKVAVLGDMLELGKYSQNLHEKVGIEIVKNNIDILITVGKEAKYIANMAKVSGMDTKNIIECKDNLEASKIIQNILCKNDTILFKASNGMHFEDIIKEISTSEF